MKYISDVKSNVKENEKKNIQWCSICNIENEKESRFCFKCGKGLLEPEQGNNAKFKPEEEKKPIELNYKECPNCTVHCDLHVNFCPSCNHKFEIKKPNAAFLMSEDESEGIFFVFQLVHISIIGRLFFFKR